MYIIYTYICIPLYTSIYTHTHTHTHIHSYICTVARHSHHIPLGLQQLHQQELVAGLCPREESTRRGSLELKKDRKTKRQGVRGKGLRLILNSRKGRNRVKQK